MIWGVHYGRVTPFYQSSPSHGVAAWLKQAWAVLSPPLKVALGLCPLGGIGLPHSCSLEAFFLDNQQQSGCMLSSGWRSFIHYVGDCKDWPQSQSTGMHRALQAAFATYCPPTGSLQAFLHCWDTYGCKGHGEARDSRWDPIELFHSNLSPGASTQSWINSIPWEKWGSVGKRWYEEDQEPEQELGLQQPHARSAHAFPPADTLVPKEDVGWRLREDTWPWKVGSTSSKVLEKIWRAKPHAKLQEYYAKLQWYIQADGFLHWIWPSHDSNPVPGEPSPTWGTLGLLTTPGASWGPCGNTSGQLLESWIKHRDQGEKQWCFDLDCLFIECKSRCSSKGGREYRNRKIKIKLINKIK